MHTQISLASIPDITASLPCCIRREFDVCTEDKVWRERGGAWEWFRAVYGACELERRWRRDEGRFG